jgi:hypothetical protein
MSDNPFPESHPCHHTRKVKDRLDDLKDHLRADVKKVDDPRAQALFETAAEVLGGLGNAFADYEKGNEAAWREDK